MVQTGANHADSCLQHRDFCFRQFFARAHIPQYVRYIMQFDYTITFIYGYVASIGMMYVGIHLSSEAQEKVVLEARSEVAALAVRQRR